MNLRQLNINHTKGKQIDLNTLTPEIKNLLKEYPALKNIFDGVYSYEPVKDKKWTVYWMINTTLFKNLLWIENTEKIIQLAISWELEKSADIKLSTIQKLLENYHNKLKQIDISNLPKEEQIKHKITLRGIEEYINKVKLAIFSLPAEIEKIFFWVYKEGDEYKSMNIRTYLLNKKVPNSYNLYKTWNSISNLFENPDNASYNPEAIVNDLEKQIYWHRPEEIQEITNWAIKTALELLNFPETKKQNMQPYLLKILSKLTWWKSISEAQKIVENTKFYEPIKIPKKFDIYKKAFPNKSDKEIQQIIDSKLEKNINALQAQKLFQFVFDIYWIKKDVKIDSSKSSLYDAEDALYIPANYKNSLKRILWLIAHEIEIHYITLTNHQNFFGNIQDKKQLEREESLAMILEEALNNTKILTSDVQPLYLLVQQLLSLDDIDETQKILLSLKLIQLYYQKYFPTYPTANNAIPRLYRIKRFHRLTSPYVQNKDTVYGKQYQIYNFLQQWNDYRLLFAGKLSLETIQKHKEYLEKNIINHPDFLQPLFIWEYLKYLIVTNQLDKIFEGKLPDIIWFLKYVKAKYAQIGFKVNLKSLKETFESFKIKENLKNTTDHYKQEIIEILSQNSAY